MNTLCGVGGMASVLEVGRAGRFREQAEACALQVLTSLAGRGPTQNTSNPGQGGGPVKRSRADSREPGPGASITSTLAWSNLSPPLLLI